MFKHKRLATVLGMVVMFSMVLTACAQPTAETIVETVIVEGTPQVIEKVVTPTVEAVSFEKADKGTFIQTVFGEPGSLDPAWNYESAGNEVLSNVYDTLVFYDREQPSKFIPQLATGWDISEDGTVYTFTLREGVTFHEGGTMTATDVAYDIIRGVLQGGGWSPQWLFTEPFYGIGVHDVAEVAVANIEEAGKLEEVLDALKADGLVAEDAESVDPTDDRALLQAIAAVAPDEVAAVCTALGEAVVPDDASMTVTMNLAQSWGPFIATLAASWGSIYPKDWAVSIGAWDGDCGTWQDYYSVDDETAPMAKLVNGSGPFKFDHWTPGEEIVLVRFDDYWRTEPAWEGGPTGPAALERVVIKQVNEWGTRFAMFQAGDTDFVSVPRENVSQVDPLVGERCDYNDATMDFDCAPTDSPEGPFRLFIGHPGANRTDAFFIFDIDTEGGNPFVGSGELDGNGIPADFFSDIHVRKAFNYCFDFDAYISEALVGEAVQNVGFLLPGMYGYDPNGDKYSFDLDKCAEEMTLAWDGAVAEVGFRVQVGFNTGNVTRQTIAQILQQDFAQVDSKYSIEIIGLPWPSLLNQIRAKRVPIFISGWIEDLHDPHNWAQPFLVGT